MSLSHEELDYRSIVCQELWKLSHFRDSQIFLEVYIDLDQGGNVNI